MPPAVVQALLDDLDLESLRIRRPSRFVFFCGGAFAEAPKGGTTLRHYLLKERRIGRRVLGDIVLAEEANELFRDSSYSDLISFEEDIARIAGLVLVIAESAGSLAELGAFATNDVIRRNILVLSQTEFSDAESFIRFGPIKRVEDFDSRRVAFFPWRTNKKNVLVKSSVSEHVPSIINLINDQLERVSVEESYRAAAGLRVFAELLWIMHLGSAMPISAIHEYHNALFGGELALNDVKRKLYTMKLAKWVRTYPYSNQYYWYAGLDDPIAQYRFIRAVANTDPIRRKAEIVTAIKADLDVPRHVLKHVAEQKRASAK